MSPPFQRLRSWQARRIAHRRLEALAVEAPWGSALASVLTDLLEGRVGDPDELLWRARIEELRERYLSDSDRRVTFLDFGAGEPGDSRDQAGTDRGRPVTRSLAEVTRRGGLSSPWRCLLFKLVRTFRPVNCLELGTSLGFSAAYQAAALEANGAGRLVTLDAAAPLVDMATRNWAELGLSSRVSARVGRFQDTLPGTLEELDPVDFALIDGHHDGVATVGYFEQILPKLARDALVIFDDVLWYEDMGLAWRRIAAHPKVKLAVDLEVLGILCFSDHLPDAGLHTVPVRALLDTG